MIVNKPDKPVEFYLQQINQQGITTKEITLIEIFLQLLYQKQKISGNHKKVYDTAEDFDNWGTRIFPPGFHP